MNPSLHRFSAAAAVVAATSAAAQTEPAPTQSLAPVEVVGHYDNRVGSSDAASSGTFTRELIEARPLARPGNLLEYVPGLVVTQHSGAGKANQYFLRGFNLDHGTDFATWVAGMPVNLRTHAHGQGYTDLNFVIPELVDRVDYFKGPYHAQLGDFASAGAARMIYAQRLPQNLALATVGEYGYARALLAGSLDAGPGTLTYGLEALRQDGPWEVPDDFRKTNAVLRYSLPLGEHRLGLTAMAYDGRWTATDQVPQRAVDDGTIGRFGSLDPSSGGDSRRTSLSLDYAGPLAGGWLASTLYGFAYRLDLFSNFTYNLNDPDNGDQFQQADDRRVYGWTGIWSAPATWGGRSVLNRLGFEWRQDDIDPVGLYATRQRVQLSTTREDRVTQASIGVFAENETLWAPWLRSVLGLRYDRYRFDVDSGQADNSGTRSAGIASPKLALIFGPWAQTEIFANAGLGFHSNDARGVTLRVDPATGEPAESATPLVRSRGAELGLRTEALPGVQSSLALWALRLASELAFVGDAGTTEAGRPSQRYGVEWSTRWQPRSELLFDLDLAWNHARFTGDGDGGNYIPGAPAVVGAAGATVRAFGPWSGALFVRYVGSYPLTEDNRVQSTAATTVDAQIGLLALPRLQVRLDVFNLFNSKASDIAYFYPSRLPGEPAGGVEDVHFHPVEPRNLRLTISYRY